MNSIGRFVKARRRIRPIAIMSVAIAALLLAGSARAQLARVNDQTATPTAGDGHAYLHFGIETMNPGAGTSSLRINPQLPAGRQLSIPFFLAYDSGSAFYLTGDPGRFEWRPNNQQYLNSGGWNYTVPMVTMAQSSLSDDYGDVCEYTYDYIFVEPDGSRRPLSVSTVSDQTQCDALWISNVPTRRNGDLFTDAGSEIVYGPDGTEYSFSGPLEGSGPGVAVDAYMIDRVEDRNGNFININDAGKGVISYIDTLNRMLISSSGFGGGTTTLSVAGQGQPWSIQWESISYNFTTNITLYSSDNAQCGATYQTASASGSMNVIQSITLPNGQSYQFEYDPTYGRISHISFPGGATIDYTWGISVNGGHYRAVGRDIYGSQYDCSYKYDEPAIVQRTVSYNGSSPNLKQTFSYSTTFVNAADWDTKQTTRTDIDPATNAVVRSVQYAYIPDAGPWLPNQYDPQGPAVGGAGVGDGGVPMETSIAEYGPNSSSPLRVRNIDWNGGDPDEIASDQEVLYSGSSVVGSSETIRCFDGNSQVMEVDEFGLPRDLSSYGGVMGSVPQCAGQGVPAPDGPLLRRTVTNYASFPAAQHIVDRPTSVITYDGSGARAAETDFTYDDYASEPLLPTASLPGHNDAFYGAGFTARGNLTAKSQWLSTSGGSLITKYQYDEAGQLRAFTDPGQHTTQYTWDSAADAYLIQVQYPDTSSPNQAHHIESYTWNFQSGTMSSHTGQNPQETTTYTYNDPLNRLTQISYPDGGQTTVTYHDAKFNLYTEIRRKIDSSTFTDTFSYFDGLGHVITTCQANGDSSLPWDRVDTQYDGEGRVAFRSYPYAATNCTGANREPGDTYSYDVLDRPLSVAHSDGSVLATSYGGAATEVADEGNAVDASGAVTQRVTRVLQHDGLGRLTAVCEVSGSLTTGADRTAAACSLDLAATGFLTTYQYDALGDLTDVHQGSGIADRTFTYDSLGRLLTASNPESGATSYAYDADGNLIRKQDANGTVTSNVYDPLHRLTSRSFAVAGGVAATPNVELDYDSDPTGRTTYNANGRLTRVWNGQVELSFNQYDAMGRAQVLDTAIGGASYHSSLSFDLIGYPTWELLPSGRQLYLTDDVEGRPRWIGDGSYSGFTYVAARYYNAAGQPDDEYLGNGLLQSWHHDARGRLIKVDLEDPAHPDYSNWRMDLDINYLPDSDVAGLVDNLGGSGQNQTYTYDALNRLSQWTTSAGLSCGFALDRYGNLAPAAANSACGMPGTRSFTPANQIVGDVYDADGNLISDTSGQSWVWNGENQLAAYQVTGPSQSAQYEYDGLGRRVAKTVDGVTTLYLRTALGPVADEVTGSTWTDSVHVPGAERVAVIRGPANGSPGTAATVAWLHADQVGTTRVLTDQNGNNLGQCNQNSYYPQGSLLTYAPFGAELDCTQSQTDYKFTGKERDAESGLDYFGARYNSSSMGRFMSPDPLGGDLTDPQSLNKYSYVLNNPLTNTDPTGLYTCADSKDCSSKKDQALEKSLAGLRNSKNADVARAANAYGAKNTDNGVSVGFADLSKSGKGGDTVSTIGVDANGNLRANSAITLNSKDSGTDFTADVGHEGSHAADAQEVVKSGLSEDGQAIHAGMNITPYQSEQRAYGVTNSILNSANESRNYVCGSGGCLLGRGATDIPGTVDRLVGSNPIYNQGGRPMSSTNQGPSVVNGVTPKATVPSVPH